MSVQAITWAYELDGLPAGQKFILVTLCNRADEDWSCYPSISRIAKETGFKDRAVRSHLSALEERGIINRERSRNSDGTLGRYRYFIQRQYMPVAKSAGGEKEQQKQEPAKSATGDNHRQKTTKTTGKICRSINRQVNHKNNTLKPKNDLQQSFEGLWSVWSKQGRKRSCGKKQVFEAFKRVCKSQTPDEIIFAAKQFITATPDHPQYGPPALERWLKNGRWEHYLPNGDNVVSLADQKPDWKIRVTHWNETGIWQNNWGPKPNEAGCQCPPELLKQGALL